MTPDAGVHADAATHDGGVAAVDAGDPPISVDAGTTLSPSATCSVPTLTDSYPGYLPQNPYDDWPSADGCVSGAHDVIILLGCPNNDDGTPSQCQTDRVDMALALRDAGYARRFITSGGAVHNAYVEADTLRDLLLAAGVPASEIVTEPQAQHTDENIYYSSFIMRDRGWTTALVVSESPGHLMMTAVCDANCCVALGRLTLYAYPVQGDSLKVGHYVLFPWTPAVSQSECEQIEQPLKAMCINMDSRHACAGNLML